MKENYKKLIIASSVVYASMGLFTPAWFLYLINTGGALQFGTALGISSIAGGLVAYTSGYLSDKISKVRILLCLYILTAVTVTLYSIVHTVIVIYLLQIIYGILAASVVLLENVLASILTPPEKRGIGMGTFLGTQQIIIGISTIIGGGLIGIIGLSNVFILTGALILVGAFIVSRIKII